MPVYTFRDTNTNDEWTDIMSISERDQFVEENPNIEQVPVRMQIVAGHGGVKNDDGWKELQSRIAEQNPTSQFAADHGSGMSAKQVKTRRAVEKWRSKRKSKGDSLS